MSSITLLHNVRRPSVSAHADDLILKMCAVSSE